MKVLAGMALLLTVAISGCNGSSTPRDGSFPTPLATPDLATANPADLVYWIQGKTFSIDDIPQQAYSLFEEIRASDDPRWLPFLLDLAIVPSPYGDRANQTLVERLGEPGEFEAFGWVEQRGRLSPKDDPDGYLEFKQALFSSIQPEIGAFIDPNAKRTISAQEILWGGVRVDGIPPLEHPAFETPDSAASWMRSDDQVIGVEINGDVRAYPRRIIDWHEMVNDTIGGVPVSLAYCTLCGSAILYDGRVGDQTYDFGTSGMLYRSNKLMYDRQTRTLWQQYSGTPVWGDLVGTGTKLKALPVTHTSYGEWLAEHPDTKVLSIDTGFRRNYGSGIAYHDYFASPNLMFPAPDLSGPLQAKDVVYVVRGDSETVAYPVRLLDSQGFLLDTIDGKPVVVIATGDGSGGRAYYAEGVTFGEFDRKKRQLTAKDGSKWEVTETALVSKSGNRLARLPGHNSFWFSVINHTEDGRLYQP